MQSTLTTRERFVRTLTGKETDRVPFMKVFGGDGAVLRTWVEKYPSLGRIIDELLDFEGGYRGWRIAPVNMDLCGEIKNEIISENDKEILYKTNYGKKILAYKQTDFHSHVLEYPVKTANDWDFIKEKYLNPYNSDRFPKDWQLYTVMFKKRDYPLQLTCGGVYGFTRNMMGDEALCYAIYDQPELIRDIMDTYIDMCIKIWEIMCRDVQFDLIECWEDMASKNGSIISPDSFNEFMAPNYKKIKAFADANNIPILLVDSDGYTDELAHLMAAAGVNAMYPFEVGAGCDTIKVLDAIPNFGAIGCLEKNSAAIGKEAIDEQMEIARKLIKHGRCIPGPDHFMLENVPFENYMYFMNSLRDVILATKPGR